MMTVHWPCKLGYLDASCALAIVTRGKIINGMKANDDWQRMHSLLTIAHEAASSSGHAAAEPSSVMNSRRLVCETANELGAPVASSIPAQLPGHEPASARMGYEDGHALFLRYRRVEGPLGRGGAA